MPSHFSSRAVICEAKADLPHWSKGTKGVIFKTRIDCAGTVDVAKVRCKGTLAYTLDGTGAPSVAASSDEIQEVSIRPARKATFYTPEVGSSPVDWSGHFQGSSACEVVDPSPAYNLAVVSSPVGQVHPRG
jgi:hypothetical protein